MKRVTGKGQHGKLRGFNEIVWFPKLYPNKDWINTFDDLTGLICMQRKDNTPLPKPTSNGKNLIVFAHQKNLFGQTVYKFYGVYTADLEKSDLKKHYFKRIDIALNLKKIFLTFFKNMYLMMSLSWQCIP